MATSRREFLVGAATVGSIGLLPGVALAHGTRIIQMPADSTVGIWRYAHGTTVQVSYGRGSPASWGDFKPLIQVSRGHGLVGLEGAQMAGVTIEPWNSEMVFYGCSLIADGHVEGESHPRSVIDSFKGFRCRVDVWLDPRDGVVWIRPVGADPRDPYWRIHPKENR